jgi:predicted transcriptional regulator
MGTVTMFYECELRIYSFLRERDMANVILESTKADSQPQFAAEYNGAVFMKLKRGCGWSLAGGSKRGRLEIMAEILVYCSVRKAKTSIMYKTNLNYSQLKRHLKFLVSRGLLGRNMKSYVTTEKGYRFLVVFAQLGDLLKKVDR